MSNVRWIKQHKVQVESGKVREFSTKGGMVHCYYASDENIEISIDGEAWAPFTRGIKIPLPFDRLFFRHETGSNETLIIVVASDPDAYHDNRELAAQIAVDGGIVTNTAPEIDNGGSVLQVGNSNAELVFNQAGVADTNVTLISAASNTSGVRIRHLELLIYSTNAAKDGATRLLISYTPLAYLKTFIWKSAEQPSAWSYDKTLDLPAGSRLEMFLRQDDHVMARINYDHL